MDFDALQTEFGLTTSTFRDNRRLHVAPGRAFELLRTLKEQHGFDMLAELTAVDYLKYPGARDRFGVVSSSAPASALAFDELG